MRLPSRRGQAPVAVTVLVGAAALLVPADVRPWLWVLVGVCVVWLLGLWLWPRKGCPEDPAALAREGENLARSIHDFLLDRRMGEPPHRFSTAKTDAGRHRQFQNQSDKTGRHSTGTKGLFQGRYQAQALDLYDRMAACGAVPPGGSALGRDALAHATNTLVMEDGATTLVYMAQQLRRK